MKRKAGLQKRVSSIFEDLNVADKMGTANQADAGAEALAVERYDRQPPAIDSLLQSQSWKIDEPVEEPVAQEATKPRKTKVAHRPSGKSKDKAAGRRIRVAAGVIVLLVMVSAVVTVNMFGRTWFGMSGGLEGNTADRAFAFAEDVAAIDWQLPRKLPEPIRDIMSPDMSPGAKAAIAQRVQPQRLVVRGILYSADQPSAIIGTQIAKVGDEIMGARIIGITRHAVELEKDGRKWMQNVEVEDVP
jgi:hypothetical protein